jgi:RNA polymerase sigma-70 factor (ECF subfamily)
MDDSHVIDQILAHDRSALAHFYHTYAPKLRRHIAARVQRPEDVEEILQDTLFGFLEAIRDFGGRSSIQTFLYAICHNKIVDFYRKKKFKHVVFSQMPQLELLVSPILDPEAEFDAKLARLKIRKVLGRMIPVHRQVILLKYLENVSVEGIAEKLSISFKSAESRLFRARKAFVELFLSI